MPGRCIGHGAGGSCRWSRLALQGTAAALRASHVVFAEEARLKANQVIMRLQERWAPPTCFTESRADLAMRGQVCFNSLNDT